MIYRFRIYYIWKGGSESQKYLQPNPKHRWHLVSAQTPLLSNPFNESSLSYVVFSSFSPSSGGATFWTAGFVFQWATRPRRSVWAWRCWIWWGSPKRVVSHLWASAMITGRIRCHEVTSYAGCMFHYAYACSWTNYICVWSLQYLVLSPYLKC